VLLAALEHCDVLSRATVQPGRHESRQRSRFSVLLAALLHCDVPSGATVQPRQGRVKVARQELPGQQKVKNSPGGDGW